MEDADSYLSLSRQKHLADETTSCSTRLYSTQICFVGVGTIPAPCEGDPPDYWRGFEDKAISCNGDSGEHSRKFQHQKRAKGKLRSKGGRKYRTILPPHLTLSLGAERPRGNADRLLFPYHEDCAPGYQRGAIAVC